MGDHVRYPCEQCNYQATHKGDLKKHQESVHKGIRYQCSDCPYQATKKSILKTHKQSKHMGVKFPCSLCDFQCTQKDNLTTHIKSIHKKIKYDCSICDFQAAQKYYLTRHIKSVHEVSAVTSLHNNTELNGHKRALRRHQQSVDDTMRIEYKCNVCNCKFESNYHLLKHKKLLHLKL